VNPPTGRQVAAGCGGARADRLGQLGQARSGDAGSAIAAQPVGQKIAAEGLRLAGQRPPWQAAAGLRGRVCVQAHKTLQARSISSLWLS
jgi:hypothetical protein